LNQPTRKYDWPAAKIFDVALRLSAVDWAEGIAADYDSQGRLAGLEILDAVKRLAAAKLCSSSCSKELGHGLTPYRRMLPLNTRVHEACKRPDFLPISLSALCLSA